MIKHLCAVLQMAADLLNKWVFRIGDEAWGEEAHQWEVQGGR